MKMSEPTYNYDELSDTLYISFAPGETATGIELTEHILLRVNKQERRAVGITLFDYSLLAQKTDIGPRSFPLTGLRTLAHDVQELVIDILRHAPISDIVTVSAYTPSINETIPIIALQPLSVSAPS